MIIDFVLNGTRVRIEANPLKRLSDTLQEVDGIERTRQGCNTGECGNCTVLIDGELVPSCLVPTFAVRSRKVTTVEGIAATITYRRLIRGFEQAGIMPCRSCFQGTLLSMYYLVETVETPTKAEIDEVLLAQRCRCIDYGERVDVLDRVISERRTQQRAALI
jgi:aerobic carbon-monoxide dehydrogenase small subunit